MTKSNLFACPSCARHVRASEATCPFCKVTLSEEFRSQSRAKLPPTRLSRAALYAAGVGAIAASAACSSATTTESSGSDSGSDSSSDTGPTEMVDAAYGGPPIHADAGTDGMLNGAYGGPPPDAGTD